MSEKLLAARRLLTQSVRKSKTVEDVQIQYLQLAVGEILEYLEEAEEGSE